MALGVMTLRPLVSLGLGLRVLVHLLSLRKGGTIDSAGGILTNRNLIKYKL